MSYYQITKNTSYLKWQAYIGEKVTEQDNLYFINLRFTKEKWLFTQLRDTLFTSFRWMPHITSTGYKWNDVVLKETEVPQCALKESYIIVSIAEGR